MGFKFSSRGARHVPSLLLAAASVLITACEGPLEGGEEFVEEAEYAAACGATNYAIGAAASAQTTFSGYSPARINDGSRSTALGGSSSWANDQQSSGAWLPQWVQLDLAQQRLIDRIDLYTTANYPLKEYDLQVWNGSSWLTAASIRGNTSATRTHTFSPVAGSKVRVLAIRGPDHQTIYARVNELEVYGCDTPYQIAGSVTDLNGNGLGGVTVQAGGVTATTDAWGNYTLNDMAAGTYTVTASRNGYTFGSAQYIADHNQVTLGGAAAVATVNMKGYTREPVVYVHGWNGGTGDLNPFPAWLKSAGYAPFYADLDTSLTSTPPLEANALHVEQAIDQATYETGRTKAIVLAHSMGGLVSRAYIEGPAYAGDVSRFFTFGSPHLGVPDVEVIACNALQPAVCQMSKAGMALFNGMYRQRAGVDYHVIGGDAPMWENRQKCIKIFGKKICITIPWPDTTWHNGKGWAMSALIAGSDDAFIQTPSSIGLPGCNVDRYVTHEVHASGFGPREYFVYSDSNTISAETYRGCVEPVLVTGAKSTCGSRMACRIAARTAAEPTAPDARVAPALGQSAGLRRAAILPGESQARSVVVEGGPTTFQASWSAGTLGLTLVDPTGKTIDPAYVQSLEVPASDTAPVDSTDISEDAVVYDAGATSAAYYFPAARAGTWQVIVEGGADVPATGATYSSSASFDSLFTANLGAVADVLYPGQTAALDITLSEAPQAASVVAKVVRADGATDTVTFVHQGAGRFEGSYAVPAASGYARIEWSASGTRSGGAAFERSGTQLVQIGSSGLTLGSGTTDLARARTDGSGLNDALIVTVGVTSTFDGDAAVSADLVKGTTIVASTVASRHVVPGSNTVDLVFSGEEIYRSGQSGPYTLTNLKLVDKRSAPLLAAEATGVHTTAAYSAASFAPASAVPTVIVGGPYRVATGHTLQLTASGVDPEGDALAYSWDLDGDGTYEASGQSVSFTASSSATPGVQPVRVRVTDPAGNAATADSTVEVWSPVEQNLSLVASASAKSTFGGYSVDRIKDGSRDANLGGDHSWANDELYRCTDTGCSYVVDLPSWVELDFHQLRTLTRVELVTTATYAIQDYDLQVWDGSGWVTALQVRGNTQAQRIHALAEVVGSKLRVVGLRGPNHQTAFVRLNEVEVHGY
ncbi:discoidin domain-containing protein [Sorangium sp. So ce315]|uniref:galactose-binding domain-containing protein n=1 Tax=Sorangium sp. So ce315 TaxID=3133299 RepID=UPI003F5D7BCC